MTGGVVFVLVDEALGLTAEAIRRRLATGAKVRVAPLDEEDGEDVCELLGEYGRALAEGEQFAEADEVARLAADWRRRFVKIVPERAAKPLPVVAR
jgi:glutamate synthase (NADPH/NADH) large chain